MSASIISVPYYREIFKHSFIIILLYLYIFQPPVVDKLIYLIFEVLIVIIYSITRKGFLLSFRKQFRTEVAILFCIIVYCLLRDLFKGELVYFDRFLAWSFQSFVVGYLILYSYHEKDKETTKTPQTNFINILYWTAFIAATLTALLIFYKPFDSFYESIQVDKYYEIYENFDVRYRAYGISENLTFTYSYVLGMFAGYTLLVLHKNRLLILPLIFFCLGVFYNARIGFVAIAILLFYFIFRFSLFKIFQLFSVLILSLFVLPLILPNQVAFLLDNSTWGLNFFYEISDFLFGTEYALNSNSTIDTLTGRFVILPPDDFISWIFGTGESLFLKSGMNSDIGYILQLYYGGIALIALLSLMVIFMVSRLHKTIGLFHWFTIFFLISILILNFKGFIFAATPGGRLLFFLYIYFVIYFKENNKNIIVNIANQERESH